MKQKVPLIIVTLILLVGFLLRLYRFDSPIADWHSWRQADTSAVSRNFVQHGFDLLHPRMNNISNVQSGMENPQGYFFVEFPLYNAAQAGLYVLFGTFTIEQWGRLVTIFSSLLGSLFLFLLVRRKADHVTAWFVLLFSVLLPYNIYYGRTILADTSMVMAIFGGIYFFDKWIDNAKIKDQKFSNFCLALLLTVVAFILKPYALFYVLPFFVLAWQGFGRKLFMKWQLWFFAVVSVLPLIGWRLWMTQYPEGIPANAWLFNGDGIRFRPAFFRWIFFERITKLIAGYLGVIFLFIGVIRMFQLKKGSFFFLSFFVSAFLYVSIIATGNVKHDYYQIVIMPAVVLGMGFGASWLAMFLQKYVSKIFAYLIVGILMAGSFWFGWQQVKDYFNINNPSMVLAGQAVDRLTPKDSLVVAPLDGDSSFLYQTNRQGWASFEKPLPELIERGADYLVLVNPKPHDYALERQYKVVEKTREYVIFDLQ